MDDEARTSPLRAVTGVVISGWLGCASLAVIVFGAGGWESWPARHTATARLLAGAATKAHGLPRGPALVIGILGALALWVAVRRIKRR